MKEISVNELPGFKGPEGKNVIRHFVYLQRLPGLISKRNTEKSIFDKQYSKSYLSFMTAYPKMKTMSGGDMNEERVLELPSGEQLHCLSYHGSLDDFVELYREYAKANNLILAKLENGKARILEGKTTQPEYELGECRAYSTDLPKGHVDPTKQALDYFGKQLVTKVRDMAIAEAHKGVDAGPKSRRNRPLAKALSQLGPDDLEAIKWLLRANIDSTMHYLLKLLEEDARIKISVQVGGEEAVTDLARERNGLFDEYFKGGSGWAAKNSKFGVDW